MARILSRAVAILLVLMFANIAPAATAADPLSLSGLGTASIDGVLAPGEWSHAGTVDFVANLPSAGSTTSARLYVMNDATNLYLAVRFERSLVDPSNSLGFDFDNDHQGDWPESGDDAIVYNPAIGFFDDFRILCIANGSPGWCAPADTELNPPSWVSYPGGLPPAGTNDGSGAFHNDGSYSVYEVAHPLNSNDDLHDFSLHAGDTVGFKLSLLMAHYPVDYADTTFPQTFGDIVIARPTQTLAVDIRPGSSDNPLNCKSRGVVPVAIFGESTFDVRTIEIGSLRLGNTAAGHHGYEDVNGDGYIDLVVQFPTENLTAAIGCTSVTSGETITLTLTGQTTGGTSIQGSDQMRIVRSAAEH